jgi:hypothetical protein
MKFGKESVKEMRQEYLKNPQKHESADVFK